MEENRNIRIKTEQQNNELYQDAGIIIYAESKASEIVNAVSAKLSIYSEDIFHAVSGIIRYYPIIHGTI